MCIHKNHLIQLLAYASHPVNSPHFTVIKTQKASHQKKQQCHSLHRTGSVEMKWISTVLSALNLRSTTNIHVLLKVVSNHSKIFNIVTFTDKLKNHAFSSFQKSISIFFLLQHQSKASKIDRKTDLMLEHERPDSQWHIYQIINQDQSAEKQAHYQSPHLLPHPKPDDPVLFPLI